MTGWRCGWTIAPKELTAAFNMIQGQSTSNITSITQKAALAALTGPQDAVTTMLDEYRTPARQHSRLADGASRDPVREAEGRVLSVPGHLADCCRRMAIRTSADFAQALLEKEHVVVTPGEAFDAPGYLRISYATSMEQLREGATRILRFAESLQPARAPARRD